MPAPLLTVEIRLEGDVVLARQRARLISATMGFDRQDQIRIGTAVSEVARNALRYAGGGKALFQLDLGAQPALQVRISDTGPGIADLTAILEGRYVSRTGMGIGLTGTQRLMDAFRIDSGNGGTTVSFAKRLPASALPLAGDLPARISAAITAARGLDPHEELQQQNHELLRSLELVRERESQLAQLNRELEDTNRGVVALYAELDERAEHLKRASEVKSRFLSNMTHEFRTPLNAILALARLLLDHSDGPLSGEQERQIRFMRKAALDLSELVNDLLDLAKVEAGKVRIVPSGFELADLFGALRGMFKPLIAGNAGVALVIEEPPGIPTMHTDEGKLSQILRNFISNALKFTEHGEVRVAARQVDAATIAISVADTGIGISPEDQRLLFVDFTQIDHSLQRQVKGTGLGLSISRQLAALLGGRITLSSDVGQGAVFTVHIPIRYLPPDSLHAAAASAPVEPGRVPVLAVETAGQDAPPYGAWLRDTPYQAIATAPAAARQAIARARPAAVLFDLSTGDGEGWRLLEELKAAPATRAIPVLAATDAEDLARARALGADDCLARPMEPRWLRERLDALTAPGGPLVLVIEDDETSRYLVATYLTGQGVRLAEAHDGRRGLEMARDLRPQAIILDLGLPERSGFEVAEALAGDQATRGIPIVVHSSQPLGDAERLRLRGCAAILAKGDGQLGNPRTVFLDALRQAGVLFAGGPDHD